MAQQYEHTGTIKKVTKTSGTSKGGKDWARTEIVTTWQEKGYGDKIVDQYAIFNAFEDLHVSESQKVNIVFALGGREYNGKYYGDNKIVSCILVGGGKSAKEESPSPYDPFSKENIGNKALSPDKSWENGSLDSKEDPF